MPCALNPLTGTVKQVAWAERIREAAANKVLASIPMRPESLRHAACDLAEQLLAETRAAWWIDHRCDNWDMAAFATKQALERLKLDNPCIRHPEPEPEAKPLCTTRAKCCPGARHQVFSNGLTSMTVQCQDCGAFVRHDWD